MSGTGPQSRGQRPAEGSVLPGWRWWSLAVLVALAVVVLLVAQPWSSQSEPPLPTASTSSSAPQETPSAPPSTPAPTPSTSVGPPGADAVFDTATMGRLFLVRADLATALPDEAQDLQPGIREGELPWGLPEGSTVSPQECTAAVTVVTEPPVAFDARSWSDDRVDVRQSVVLLPDGPAARSAFRTLVTTVDGCPTYRQVNPGTDGARWTAEPALEGQGVYPSIVQEIVHHAEGVTAPGYRGHMLVGNAIVSWDAEAPEAADAAEARGVLGEVSDLASVVQDRARTAVGSLG